MAFENKKKQIISTNSIKNLDNLYTFLLDLVVYKKNKKIWFIREPLFEELKKDFCYLCHKKIEEKDRIKVGENIYRHKKCNPLHFENVSKLNQRSQKNLL